MTRSRGSWEEEGSLGRKGSLGEEGSWGDSKKGAERARNSKVELMWVVVV